MKLALHAILLLTCSVLAFPQASETAKTKEKPKTLGAFKREFLNQDIIVNDVSFQIQPGEILGLLGPNGAGKTSIISTMVTLEKPTSGTIRIFGYNVETDSRTTKSLTGFVPQELIHHGYFDVIEILQFHYSA